MTILKLPLLALGSVVVAINIKAMYEVWKFKTVIFAFFLAFAVAGKAQSVPATYPDRMDAKPQEPIITGQGWTVLTNANTLFSGPIGTCQFADDGVTPKDCKITEGHTLDELVGYFLKQQREADAKYAALLKMSEEYVTSVKSDPAIIGADIKAAKLDISANSSPPAKHHSTAPRAHQSHRRIIHPAQHNQKGHK